MGPLQGKRIIELGGVGPAPFCGMLFADMGADVILVERKTRNPNDIGLTSPDAARFSIVRRGKRSIALDLKKVGAGDAIMRLVRECDGLIEGFRPGVMERLGLGPEECLRANPRLVFGRLTGWGQEGPLASAAGHDLNYVALSGALYYSGCRDTPPSVPPTLVGDICGGAMMLAVGMLGAMLSAGGSGKGQIVDAAITDGSALATALLYGLHAQGLWGNEREANFLDGGSHWYRSYECADGKYISIAALEPGFYKLLIDKLGLIDEPAFADQHDRRRWQQSKQRFGEIFKTRTRDEWCDVLEGTDVCFAPVLNFAEAPKHPHNKARKSFMSVAGVTQPAPAPRFSATPSEVSAPPPEIGEHAEAILGLAGYSQSEIAALREQQVI
jgi:alpha-methylacyl-CoA racemase